MLGHVQPLELLLADDNPGDVELTREALAGSKICNQLHVVGDGVEAIDFLKRRGAYAAAVRPDVILLDLHMPRMDGREVLEIIKNDPELKTLPVVILTSSEAEKNIVKSHKLPADCYLNKPVDLERFLELVRAVDDFWLSVVRLPEKNRGDETNAERNIRAQPRRGVIAGT